MHYHFQIMQNEKGEHYAHCVEIFFCAVSLSHRDAAPLEAYAGLTKFLSTLPTTKTTASPFRGSFQEIAQMRRCSPGDIIAIPVSVPTALALSLRRLRAMRGWNQSEVARRLGLASLSAYQRLEDPLRTNPTLTTLMRLKTLYPDLDIATIVDDQSAFRANHQSRPRL